MFFFLSTLILSVGALAADSRTVDRPLQRLEQKIVDARASGRVDPAEYDKLRSSLEHIKIMREEAFADGKLTSAERDALLKAIRSLEVDVAEARYGARKTDEASDTEEVPDLPALTGNPVPKVDQGAGSAQ